MTDRQSHRVRDTDRQGDIHRVRKTDTHRQKQQHRQRMSVRLFTLAHVAIQLNKKKGP